MTNKRKQRARAVSAKTSVSYVGAINLMNKERLPIHQVESIESFFVHDTLPPLQETVGGFERVNFRAYRKAEEVAAYLLGEDCNTVLLVQKPSQVIVTAWEVPPIDNAWVRSRLEVLFECRATNPVFEESAPEPEALPLEEARKQILEHFKGREDTVRLLMLRHQASYLYGVLDNAGVIIQEPGRFGAVLFSDRVKAVQLQGIGPSMGIKNPASSSG